jgi:hypothetical protein
MRIVALVLVLLHVPMAAAAPASMRLTMKQTDATNVHMADEGGAINSQTAIAIDVELRADRTLAGSVAGVRSEHNLYPGPSSRSTDDKTGWTTHWKGTWSRTSDELELVLELVDQTCNHAETTTEYDAARGVWVHYTPEPKPCSTAGKHARLSCTTEQIELDEDVDDDASQASAKAKPVAAWLCAAQTPSDLGNSPAEWTLGKTTCIEVLGGHMTGRSYRACAP